MDQTPARVWLTEPELQFAEHWESVFDRCSLSDLDCMLHDLVEAQEAHIDRDCISLYAGTNVPNPRASRLLASTIGSRPSLGHPGNKYNRGMETAERLEVMSNQLIRRLFRASFAETRVASGSMANLYAFMALTSPGDRIMSFSESAGGHVTHHAAGAAGLYGLDIHEVPFDPKRMDVDTEKLRTDAHSIRPRLIVIAGSLCLFPYNVRAVREIADEVGAAVMYDAAHMAGIIAGGEFQDPLAEGADVMTASTYKSFGGPPGGVVLTNSAAIAARLDRVAHPGLTANFDLAQTAALVISTLDLLECGNAYARMCIDNAGALATALHRHGVHVYACDRGWTQSQHIAIDAHAYGGGATASRQLERANILASGIGLPITPQHDGFNGIRLGTQEITRWGMTPHDMVPLADLIARALHGRENMEALRHEVMQLRQKFQELHFIRARSVQTD